MTASTTANADSGKITAAPTAKTTAAAQPAAALKTPDVTSTGSSSTNTAASAQTTMAPLQPVAPAAAGQRAFIDPVTGELRQPEHDEVAAVAAEAAAAAPARRAAARTATAAQEFIGDDGSVSAVVPEELHTFTVATRDANGRVVIEHAQGAKNAASMIKANRATKTPQAPVSRAQQKEDRHDR
jgi:hypothetical protein